MVAKYEMESFGKNRVHLEGEESEISDINNRVGRTERKYKKV